MTTVKKAVITAAGKGTRQYPATKTVQKELFPLVDVDGYCKPTLQIIVEEALASGMDEVCVIANPTNVDAIRRHFERPSDVAREQLAGKDWAMALADRLATVAGHITFVVQETQDGYGHAVLQARDWVGDEPFAVMLGDHVYIGGGERCAKQAADVYCRYGKPVAAVESVDEGGLCRTGVVRGELLTSESVIYKIASMEEKPSIEQARRSLRTPGVPDGQYLGFFGIHVFPPTIFDCLQYLVDHDIRVRGEIQLTSAQELMLSRTDTYLACSVDGNRYDTGVPEGLIETQIALALHSPYRAQALRALSGA
jgi:UTP--glucose-1-phosphate uridylyltransferase